MREVTFYTRQLCGLCDEAAAELARLAPELGFNILERDIDTDAGLRARFNDVVPVIAVGDREVARAPIDAAGLRRLLLSAFGA